MKKKLKKLLTLSVAASVLYTMSGLFGVTTWFASADAVPSDVHSAKSSPIFAKKLTQSIEGFDKLGMQYNGVTSAVEVKEVAFQNPVSLSLTSGCLGSLCFGSLCLGSLCAGSICYASGCPGSTCVSSGCVGSVCLGSVCSSSVCIGSACVSSLCAGDCPDGRCPPPRGPHEY